MNKRFITLQILGIILASFSQLFCVEQEVLDPQPNCRAATSHVPVVSAVEFSDAALQRAAAPLSQGMGAGAEVTVISTAAAFCNWVLSAGKDAAMSISQWMSGNDKADVLNAIAAAGVPDGLLTDTFVEAVNRLFQGRGGFDETRMIRALASMPVERLTPEFVAAVNRLSQEIMVCKEYVIRALAGVPVERLTPAFVEAASCLSQEMGVYDQVTVIKALAGVPAERLEVFAAAMNRLSSGMGGGGKSNVIKAVASIPAERLTPAFEAAVNRLSNGMGGKTNVISALASMPAERLTSAFEAAVNRLSNGMGGGGKTNVISAKSFVIGTLASMPAERLTPAFEAAVNRLSQGIDEYSKTYVIRDLASIPAERLEVFEAAVNRLSNGMSGDAKAKVIGVLAGVPVGRLTPEFVAVVNAMTQGMAMNAKVCVIFSSASLSADRLTPAFAAVVNRIIQGMDGDTAPLILNEFFKETNLNIIFAINQGITDAQMNGIRQFVPAIQRVDLFHRLSNLATPAERATEINRVIELYRHVYVAGAHLGAGKADIHRYSGAAVVNKVTNKKQQLNEAVIERLEARLSNTNTASYNAAIAAVSA